MPTKRCAVFAPYLLFGGKVRASGVVLAVCACAKGNSDIFTVKLKDWTQSVQAAIPCGFYMITVHDLKRSFFVIPGAQREKLSQEFILDLLQWWD